MGCLLGVAVVVGTGCGSSDSGGGGTVKGDTLTIYSSLPRQGASRVQAIPIEQGAALALKQRGGKVGKWNVKYVKLDDATAAAGQWDAAPTSSNARKASQDKRSEERRVGKEGR